ncbi:hypothetical protein PMI01_02052 [Caulobacter sp. AP07]|uniref:phosphoribosyltransferase n=1 Tax=Caulobacter sp. AP07 TaxID=1144304 RepID=UPI0002720BEE|nr:phosphoribosyltransferase [Caulobacter sp. AP07]EJL33648.1 hypothetical protein PMI01_02052 [Caulobacter sp. AP07]
MSYAVSNFRKLAVQFPKLLSTTLNPAIPLLQTVDELMASSEKVTLPARWVLWTLDRYRNSRPYHEAVVKGRSFVDFAGNAVRPPTTAEIDASAEVLARYSIDACIAALTPSTSSTLSVTQCVEMLYFDREDLKHQSSRLSRTGKHDRARAIRQTWRAIALAIHQHDPTDGSANALAYAEYHLNISNTLSSTFSSKFDEARQFSRDMASSARSTSTFFTSFFPNYFHDETEMVSNDSLIDAMESFMSENFDDAHQHFLRWTQINSGRSNNGSARHDSNIFNQALCLQLSIISQGNMPDWREINALLSSPSLNIYRTARALWDHTEKVVVFSRDMGSAGNADSLKEALSELAAFGHLLSIDAPISPRDRSASIEEKIKLPEVVDLYDEVAASRQSWDIIATHMLRMPLIMRCDYEKLNFDRSINATCSMDGGYKNTSDLESLSNSKLLDYAAAVMSTVHSEEIIHRWKTAWTKSSRQISLRDAPGALSGIREFHAAFRATPHLVEVLGAHVEQVPGKVRKETLVTLNLRRCWKEAPTHLLLDRKTNLAAGQLAYMRPRWNRSLKTGYNGADEPLLPSRAPAWMEIFASWSGGKGPVIPDRFLDWVRQFDIEKQALALRLLTSFRFYNDDDIRDRWARLFARDLPYEAKSPDAVLVPAGSLTKSGTHHAYLLRQALSRLSPSECGIDPSIAFMEARQLIDGDSRPGPIVIFDDFIGSGDQMARFIANLHAKNPNLKARKIFVIAIVAFDEAIRRLENQFASLSVKVFASDRLPESARAFHARNPIWDSDQDRSRARTWASQLGRQLVAGVEGMESERDALGWKGGEALIAFSYNTPNNTLPIFWSRTRSGAAWAPLFERYG